LLLSFFFTAVARSRPDCSQVSRSAAVGLNLTRIDSKPNLRAEQGGGRVSGPGG
jgi:hypothetical protein